MSNDFRVKTRYLSTLLGLGLTAAWFAVKYVVEADVERRVAAYVAAADPRVEQYCAAQESVARDGFLLVPTWRGEDAGALLNPNLSWNGEPTRTGPLGLPRALVTRVDGWGGDWWTEGAYADLTGLDFSWMATLDGYSHWFIFTQSPLESATRLNPFTAPLPDFATLVRWAKLRLLTSVREGTTAQAAAEVRQLARLAWSTQLVQGARTGVQLLRLERTAWEALQQSEAAPQWEPISAPTLAALEQVSHGSALFHLAVLPRPAVNRLLTCGTPATRCPLLNDQSIFVAMRRAFEDGDDGRFEALKGALRSCDARLAASFTAFFGQPGEVPPDAVEAVAEQRGALGSAATRFEFFQELLVAVALADSLPRPGAVERVFPTP